MSRSDANGKPVTRGKKYDYLKMSKGKPQDDDGSSSQSDQVDEHEFMGAGAIASNLYGASGGEEFDYDEGSVRYETGQRDVTSHKQNSFPELSVEAALANEDENNRRLKAELEALKQQEVLLQKRAESDQLRKQLAEQRAKVAKLRGNTIENESRAKIGDKAQKLKKTVSHKNQSQTLLDDNDIDIVKLRKNKHLKKRVRKQMKKLGLDDNSDADESNFRF